MAAHARLGPSNPRWVYCPGSVREEARYPDLPGEAAIDGTGSHELLEMCLKNDIQPHHIMGEVISVGHEDMPQGWIIHADRADRVMMCIAYIDRRVAELHDQFNNCTVTVESESRSNPGLMICRDDWWGTVDVTIIVRSNATNVVLYIEVVDYKDGRGWVHANDNTQLLSYLIGKANDHNTFKFIGVHGDHNADYRITIVQPKTNPVVRYQDVTHSQMAAALNKFKAAAHKTDDPNAPLIPDDKGGKGYCRWCKHRDYCTAETQRSIEVTNELLPLVDDDVNLLSVDPTSLSHDQLSKMMDAEPGINAAFDRLKKEAVSRIDRGEELPGYAMQHGNDTRAYNADEKAIVTALKSRRFKKGDIYPSKLITPAQVLKSDLLSDDQKKRFEEEYISKVAGKLALKKVSYKKPTEADMFADVPAASTASLFDEPISFI
jgi:hypothetical protein